MPPILSITFRVVYFIGALLFSLSFGVGVAMGFDSGINTGSVLLAFLYFFTCIPALILAFIPASILTRPPLILKVWYWWIGILLVIYGITLVYHYSKGSIALTDEIIHGPKHGTICISLKDQDSLAWIDISSPKIDFERDGHQPLTSSSVRCHNYGLHMTPISIRAYSVTRRNRDNHRATPDDNPSSPMAIHFGRGEKVCVGVFSSNTPSGPTWITRTIDCKR